MTYPVASNQVNFDVPDSGLLMECPLVGDECALQTTQPTSRNTRSADSAGLGSFSPAGSSSKRLATGMATCLLVVLMGSVAIPQVLLRTHNSLPQTTVPISMSRAGSLQAVADLTLDLGLSGTAFLAADFGDSRVFALPHFDLPTGVSEIYQQMLPTGLVATWEDIQGTPLEVPCAAAHFLVSTLVARVMPGGQAWSLPSTSEIDWGPGANPSLGQVAHSSLQGWERAVALMEQAERSLFTALRAIPSIDPHFEYLSGCASRVFASTRPSFLDVPSHLRNIGDPVHDRKAGLLPFSHRFTPVRTKRLPKAQQKQTTAYRPRSFLEILEPDALQAIIDWLHIEASNMEAIQVFGAEVRRIPHAVRKLGYGVAIEPHEVLVIGQDQFLPAARGVIWDCRGFEFGEPAVPMDFDAPLNSQLSSKFIETELKEWPDQELVGMLLDGVQFKADLPLQIVLGPHLTSLSKAYGNVQKEILRLKGDGYYRLHHTLPFLPFRAMPQGSTPRKLEEGRDRRTTDGGAPRRRVCDRAGIPAVSLNVAIALKSWIPDAEQPEIYDNVLLEFDEDTSLHDQESMEIPLGEPTMDVPEDEPGAWVLKWLAPEVKPQVQDKARDDFILRHLALNVFHEPILGWTDDVADFFNHLPLAPSEYWVSCLLWSFGEAPLGDNTPNVLHGFRKDPLSSPVSVISEHRLGFGVSLSPNVAQRFSHALLSVWRHRFDAEELVLFNSLLNPVTNVCTPYSIVDSLSLSPDGWTDVCRFIDQRRRLSRLTGNNELRRYSVHMYTDDPCFTVVGTDALIRAMRIWQDVTSSFNLKMAIARKRQVGTRLTWLGFNFYLSSGIISAAPEKVSRGRAMLESILDGAVVTFDQYRRLLGLLEHLLPFVGGDRTHMYGLYGWNFKRGILFGPVTRMVFGERQVKGLQWWLRTLMVHAGSFNSAALWSTSVPIPSVPPDLFRDSCLCASLPPKSPAVIYSLYSDAAVEATSGGLGGWAHGQFWHFPLLPEFRDLLHITAWEFVALAFNVIIFGRRLGGEVVHLLADALATVQIMVNRAAHSPTMQIIHSELLQLPEFAKLGARLSHSHVFGEVNVVADAASRGNFDLIYKLAAQLGQKAQQINVPPEALAFLERVLVAVRAETLASLGFGPIPPPRAPSEAELKRLQHRGIAYSTAEDQPIRYRFITHHGSWLLFGREFSSDTAGDGPTSSSMETLMAQCTSLAQHGQRTASPPLFVPSDNSTSLVWPIESIFPVVVSSEQRPPVESLASQCISLAQPAKRTLSPPVFTLTTKREPLYESQSHLTSALAAFSTQRSRPRSPSALLPPDFPEETSMSPSSALRRRIQLSSAEPAHVRSPFQSTIQHVGMDRSASRNTYMSSFGKLPPVPSSHVPIDDVLFRPTPTSLSPLAHLLLSDDSDQALRPSDPSLLLSYVEAVGHTVSKDVKPETLKKDNTGWNRWVKFMSLWNSPPLRVTDPRFVLRERFLKGAYLIWAKRCVKSSIPGRQFAKPATLMGDLYAVARVHRRNDQIFSVKGMVREVQHYLCMEYELVHGPECLIPQRREGFSRAHLRAILACPSGLPLHSRTCPSLIWKSWLGYTLAASLCLSSSGGFRKAEISLPAGVQFSAMHMSRASLFWVIEGRIYRQPSVAQLMSMKKGDQAGILACPSKADDLGLHFLPHPLFFNFDPDDPDNTALRFREMYIHCPVRASEMRSTPLFTMSAAGEPLRRDFLDMVLKALLRSFMDEETAKLYSWHSFRIGLACALRAVGAPDWIILALCRWRSIQSLKTYARINSSVSAQWLDRILSQTIDSIQTPNVGHLADFPPELLSTEIMSFLERAEQMAETLSPNGIRNLVPLVPEIDDDRWMQELASLQLDSDGDLLEAETSENDC